MSAPHREASVLISASDVTLVEVLDLSLQQPAWRCSPMAAAPGGTRRQPFRCRAVTPTGTRHAAARLATPVEDLDCATRFDIDPLTERLGYAVRFVRTYPTRSSTKAASSAARRSTSRSATSTWFRRRSTRRASWWQVECARVGLVSGEEQEGLVRALVELHLSHGRAHAFDVSGERILEHVNLDPGQAPASDWRLL